MFCLRLFFASVLSVWFASQAAAETINVSDSQSLLQTLQKAKPGTTVLLAPGVYRGGLRLVNLRGEPGRPIVIAAADPQRPPVFAGGANCLQLSSPEHVELRWLVLSKARANGINIDDGGDFRTPAHHIVFKNVIVRDIGPDGNRDGIKLSGVTDFSLQNCTIRRWGSRGSAIDMVGCHRGQIINCTFVEGDESGSNAVQTKGGSRDILISRCRFENAGSRAINIGGGTGLDFFRPKPLGYEAKDITVEDCTFIGSMAPIAFVGVDGAAVRHNTFYDPQRWLIRILQENQSEGFVSSRGGRFTDNIIVFRASKISAAVNIGPKTAPKSFTFAHNFWFCSDRPQRSKPQLPRAETKGVYGQDPRFQDAAKGDLRLKADSPAKGFGVREDK